MDVAKKMIISCLKQQVQPVNYSWLAKQVGINDRECRELVAEIVIAGECPIVSSSDKDNGGYFIAKSHKDIEIAIGEGMSRIQQIQRRLTGLKKAADTWFTPAVQDQFEFGREKLKEIRGTVSLSPESLEK